MPIYKMQGKKDGLQKYRVRINYIDSTGNPRQLDRVAYGLPEAKDLEYRLVQEYTGVVPMDTRRTVQQLYDEYIAAKKNEVRASTLDKTKQVLNLHILPVLGSVRLDRLTAPVLQKWKNDIASGSYALSTRRNIYKELRALLNFAVNMDYLPKNPLLKVGNFKEVDFFSAADELHYYTAEQFASYISAARALCVSSFGMCFYVFFCIAFYTGMRKGEINALKWSDIYDDTVHIRRSVAQKLKGGDVETAPKNKSSIRDVRMPAPLVSVLNDHKARQQALPGFSEDFRVCGGTACLRDTTIDVKNREFAAAAGLPRIRIHDFRHSHASLLANEGINIKEISRRLGHSNVDITWKTYAHLYPREEDRALEVLNKIQLLQ